MPPVESNAMQLNITIVAVGYRYPTHRYPESAIYGRDFMSKATLDERVEFNLETVRRIMAARPSTRRRPVGYPFSGLATTPVCSVMIP